MFSAFEEFGAVWDAQATKDLFIFAANTHVSGIEAVTRLIADNALRPAFTKEQVSLFVHAMSATHYCHTVKH